MNKKYTLFDTIVYFFTRKQKKIDALTEEVTVLKEKLSEKQKQINKVNKYWKGVVYNLKSKPKPAFR